MNYLLSQESLIAQAARIHCKLLVRSDLLLTKTEPPLWEGWFRN